MGDGTLTEISSIQGRVDSTKQQSWDKQAL